MLCFGAMLQVDWQEEARKARRRWLDAHKDIDAAGLLQPALSGTDLEQPLMSGLDSVPEQSGNHLLPVQQCAVFSPVCCPLLSEHTVFLLRVCRRLLVMLMGVIIASNVHDICVWQLMAHCFGSRPFTLCASLHTYKTLLG